MIDSFIPFSVVVSGGSVVQTISSVGVKGAKIIWVYKKEDLIRIQLIQKLNQRNWIVWF